VKSGDVVLLRSVYGGRVRWTFPHPRLEPGAAHAVELYWDVV
jgi:hypothetical protein